MDFELGAEHRRLQAEAAAFAESIAHLAPAADESSSLHPEVHAGLAASGLGRVAVPAEFGGRFERVDPIAICIVREALMARCSQADALFALQGIGSYSLAVAGSAEQRAAWLPRVAALDAIAALALTEPDAGSDLKSLTTSVAETGGELVVNGRKSFISNAGVAAFYTTLAREADGSGLSLVLVPADAPGVDAEPGPELIAAHVIGDVTYTDVRLPASARVGAKGAGFEPVTATLAIFRASVGAAAVGLARRALDLAARHAGTRSQFGRPLYKHGSVGALLADSWTEVEMARLLVYRAAWLATREPAASIVHSSMAKLAATEAAGRVVDRAVQVMGRFGLVKGSEVERLYREARPMRVYEGASEVLKVAIARDLVSGAMGA